jgi:hypothetical protein
VRQCRVHDHRAADSDDPAGAAQAEGQRERGEQEDLRDQPGNWAGVHRPPYLSNASLSLLDRSEQSMVVSYLTASRRQNRMQDAVMRSGWDILPDEGRETVRACCLGPARIVLSTATS